MSRLIKDLLAQIDRCDQSDRALSIAATGNPDTIRNIRSGRAASPTMRTIEGLAKALGLEFRLGPRRPAAAPAAAQRRPLIGGRPPGPADGMERVQDPALAEAIAVLADAWDAADTRARGHLLGRFDLAFAEERSRAAAQPRSRVLAWLGWRVIEGGKTASS